MIKEYKIEDRVYFPNKFLYKGELKNQIKDCHVGVALYAVDPNTVTYYADPAKIKQYAEFGLPIVMTNAADIAKYIKRFHAGEVVTRDIISISNAFNRIKNNYQYYLEGLNRFNHYFEYNKYFSKKFKFIES